MTNFIYKPKEIKMKKFVHKPNIRQAVVIATEMLKFAEFDNDKFEQWCIDRAREGYEVFACEYNIDNPAFEEVWSKNVINCGGGNKNQKRSVEKLYHVK